MVLVRVQGDALVATLGLAFRAVSGAIVTAARQDEQQRPDACRYNGFPVSSPVHLRSPVLLNKTMMLFIFDCDF
jgi:hypothetical protein